jgi:hypothetical protein
VGPIVGGLNFNGAIPITGATGTYSVPVVSYYHPFGFFGRSANVTAFLPYGVGTFQGSVLGTQRQVYRSGLLDLTLRFSVNLKGGPAMAMPQFVKWKQKTLLGASLTVVAPTGQYDPTHLVNWSINRWAFKPELGYSRRWGNWVLDGYGGVFSIRVPHCVQMIPLAQQFPYSQERNVMHLGRLETNSSLIASPRRNKDREPAQYSSAACSGAYLCRSRAHSMC